MLNSSQNISQNTDRRVLVIGAYGFIGASLVMRLQREGFVVSGFGRSQATAYKVMPDINWHIADLKNMITADDWQDYAKTHDIIINCAGALQDGASDSLKTVHFDAIKALSDACKSNQTMLIQISAVGAERDADTAFMRTKAMGDDYIRENHTDYNIFRPGLVLAKNAYGGSALLRMLAAFPLVQPIALANSQVQATSIYDLTDAVVLAANNQVPKNKSYDLVERQTHSLREVVQETRHWLGFSSAVWQITLPNWSTQITAKIADFLSLLGWRSPLRSTAISVLKSGIKGDPDPWRKITKQDLRPLNSALSHMPAAVEDRLFARMSLLMPIIIFCLASFWLASGIIGLWQIDRAANVLTDIGWSDHFAKLSIGFWSIVDIALGLGVLIRKSAKIACWAMIAVSFNYLISAAVVTPQLWADPLGPMVKVFPGIVLALVGRVTLDNR
ncbi:MAG: SDR family oxidoreductase [Lentilitoribacter sp.]